MFTKATFNQIVVSAARWIVPGVLLTACNLTAQPSPTPGMNVTEAYQTVEANLTRAAALTPAVTSTPIPTESGLPTPTTPASATPVPTEPPLTETPPCDLAAAGNPLDITIPDDTRIKPGQAFTKIWSLVNVGSCTWTNEYAAVWFSGEMMGAPSSVPLGRSIAPGEAVEITVDMAAPTAPGTYQSNWKLRNASGVMFGIGPSGQSPFWARIEVVAVPTSTPEVTVVPTTTVTVTPTPVAQAAGRVQLSLDEGLDLDTGQVSAGPEADFLFHQQDQQDVFLTPGNGVLLGTFGPAQPSLKDCQNALLSAVALPLNDLPAGTHICYRTNLDRFGWARLEQLDLVNFTLDLTILTWAPPTRPASQPPSP